MWHISNYFIHVRRPLSGIKYKMDDESQHSTGRFAILSHVVLSGQ